MTVRSYQFIVGAETSTLPTTGTPTDPSDTVTLEYADANYTQGKASVSNVAALQAIAAADRSNGDLVVVRSSNTSYVFDSASSESADGTRIIQPSSGSGRWIMSNIESLVLNGSGELNVIDNNIDANLGWAASGAGVTVATTTSSTDLPLSGIFESAIKITPVSSTAYAYYRWTQPETLKNTKLKISWNQRPLSGYASGDFKLEIYKNSASNYGGSYTEFALSTDSSGTSSIPNANGLYTSSFDADSADYYELRIVRTAGTTALNITNVIVGPGTTTQGAVVTAPQTYTMTIGATTTPPTEGSGSTKKAYWTRRGGNMLIQFDYTQSNAGSAGTGTYLFPLPSGYTIDTSHFAAGGLGGGGANIVGSCIVRTSGTQYYGVATIYNSTNITLAVGDSSAVLATVGSANSSLSNATQYYAFQVEVPIAEWAQNGTVNLSQNNVEYVSNSSSSDAADTTAFIYGPAGSVGVFGTTALTAARKKRVRFTTPLQAGDVLQLEVDFGGVGLWASVGQGTLSNNDGINLFSYQNTASYGMSVGQVSATDFDVLFGQYAFANGATFGSAGKAWNSGDYASTRWRLKKVSAGVPVGFGLVSDQSSGLLPASNASLDNASATRLGLKAYSHGTNYNGGVAPTITLTAGGGTLSSIAHSQFYPKQLQDGTWVISGNFLANVSSAARTQASFTLNGITASGTQGFTGYQLDTTGAYTANVYINDTAAAFNVFHQSATTTQYVVNFNNIKVSSKPSWAY